MADKKSILTSHVVTYQTPPLSVEPRVGWNVDNFEELIQSHGYDALIDRALKCPCADKNNGQALSTCKNCGGRGWFFIDRTETRLVAQHMGSNKKYQDWSEINRGTASITTRGIDKLGFMDRIILTQLEEYYSEILRPIYFNDEIIAYPVYEPLTIEHMLLFSSDSAKLIPLEETMYTVEGNKIIFSKSIEDLVEVNDMNVTSQTFSVTMRYSHFPVYHAIDINRELMKVRESKLCGIDDKNLSQMPINITARKAHFIFDSQRWGEEIYDNSVLSKARKP